MPELAGVHIEVAKVALTAGVGVGHFMVATCFRFGITSGEMTVARRGKRRLVEHLLIHSLTNVVV